MPQHSASVPEMRWELASNAVRFESEHSDLGRVPLSAFRAAERNSRGEVVEGGTHLPLTEQRGLLHMQTFAALQIALLDTSHGLKIQLPTDEFLHTSAAFGKRNESSATVPEILLSNTRSETSETKGAVKLRVPLIALFWKCKNFASLDNRKLDKSPDSRQLPKLSVPGDVFRRPVGSVPETFERNATKLAILELLNCGMVPLTLPTSDVRDMQAAATVTVSRLQKVCSCAGIVRRQLEDCQTAWKMIK